MRFECSVLDIHGNHLHVSAFQIAMKYVLAGDGKVGTLWVSEQPCIASMLLAGRVAFVHFVVHLCDRRERAIMRSRRCKMKCGDCPTLKHQVGF